MVKDMYLNKKGFTLVEVLAVIIILSMIIAITVPNVYKLINKGKEDSYVTLKNSFVAAAKNFVSDNRYEISVVQTGSCVNNERNVLKIGETLLDDNKLTIDKLVNGGYIKKPKDGIKNPKDDKVLDVDDSYVIVKYDCSRLDYNIYIDDSYLLWN